MTRVAQAARIKLRGFDTEGIDEHSPLEDQAALTYKAAYHYADANNFERAVHRGVPGRKGPMVMRRITDSLFDSADSNVRDRINGLVSQVLRKTDACVCIVHSQDREKMSTWFVADRMPENLTIVALNHRDKPATPVAKPLIPTDRERKLTPAEAGEDRPPSEVTVKQGEPKTKTTMPQASMDAFERQILERQQQHKLFVEQVHQLVVERAPLSANDVRMLLSVETDYTTEDSSSSRIALHELEAAGRVVKRKEEDSERLIRGGGRMPKGSRVFLFGPAPGPVPVRRELPVGVTPKKSAADWDKERQAELDTLCDKVLTVLSAPQPRGSKTKRPRSVGLIAQAAGISNEDAARAIQRLIKLDLVYRGQGNSNYFLTERRRGPKSTSYQDETGLVDTRKGEHRLPALEDVTVIEPPAAQPDDLAAELAAVIARHTGGSGEVEQLRARVAELEEKVEQQAKRIVALKGVIAAFEE